MTKTYTALLLALAACNATTTTETDPPAPDAGPSCILEHDTDGVAWHTVYATDVGNVELDCFDDRQQDLEYPDGCGGCGLNNGKPTAITTWAVDSYCLNSAAAIAACKGAPACITGPEALCP